MINNPKIESFVVTVLVVLFLVGAFTLATVIARFLTIGWV